MNFLPIVLGLLLFSAFSHHSWAISLPSHCEYDKRCIIELPESRCADGTQSYFSLIARKNSPDLVIYLEPGGACWDKKTCDFFHVDNLTRKDPQTLKIPEQGLLDPNNPDYPFYSLSLATIPYCTGDVFMGNNKINYGTPEKPLIIHHRGFQNVQLAFDQIKNIFDSPQKVILFGRSAGGLGVLGHLRNLDKYFPQSEKFGLSDAGTPISPPFVNDRKYQGIMNNWKVSETLPTVSPDESMESFGDLLRYNTRHFPHIRFGFIQSYDDPVMTYFAKNIGSSDPSEALKANVIAASTDYIGTDTSHAKVFFLRGKVHVITRKPLRWTRSMDFSLLDWLNQMFYHGDWYNVRPDVQTP